MLQTAPRGLFVKVFSQAFSKKLAGFGVAPQGFDFCLKTRRARHAA
jgi:hypothetical protein